MAAFCQESGFGSDTSDEESGSGDLNDFTEIQSFQLTTQQVDKCLTALKCRNAGPARKTCTSCWSKKVSSACAAYKLLKVKRWLLTNDNLIFDPLLNDTTTVHIQPSELLWHPEDSPSDELQIKSLCVDGLLCKIPNGQAKRQNLMRIDKLMHDINWPSVPEKHDMAPIFSAAKSLPIGLVEPFYNFMFAFYNALFESSGTKVQHQDLFERLFKCITACLGEDIMIQCRPTIDGRQSDKLKLAIPSDNPDHRERHLLIRSASDLFIFERTSVASKRGIAVVQVKGKKGDKILHSDDENEELGSLANIDEESEESEEELSMVEKVRHKRHRHMTKVEKKTRQYVRKFLPQLIGEMIGFSETKGIERMKPEEPGFSFGVAVVGFDVYFVSLVRSDGESIRATFHQHQVFTHVFITRAFDIRNRTDRRIVLKTLAAACYVERPLLLPNDIPSGLEVGSLRL